MNTASMKCLPITSSGIPSRSYMARKNSGIMTTIMPIDATEMLPDLLRRKNTGTPIAAAIEKHMICRLVSPNAILVLTLVRSLGTEI